MRARIARSFLPAAPSNIERKLLSKLRKALESSKTWLDDTKNAHKHSPHDLVLQENSPHPRGPSLPPQIPPKCPTRTLPTPVRWPLAHPLGSDSYSSLDQLHSCLYSCTWLMLTTLPTTHLVPYPKTPCSLPPAPLPLWPDELFSLFRPMAPHFPLPSRHLCRMSYLPPERGWRQI